MPNVNISLFATYTEAKKTYFEKIHILEASIGKHGPNGRTIKNRDVRAIKSDMEGAFLKLDRPAVWTELIEFDNAKLMEPVRALQAFGNDNFAEILEHLVTIEALLEGILVAKRSNPEHSMTITSVIILESTAVLSNTMNAEVRNALLLMDRKIDQRISQFDAAGIDLFDDPDFPTMEDRHTNLVNNYDGRLLANTITGTANDRDTIQASGDDIAAAPDVPSFKERYTRLDNFIQGKLGGV